MHEIREREGGREAFKNCKKEHKNKKKLVTKINAFYDWRYFIRQQIVGILRVLLVPTSVASGKLVKL